MDSPLLSHTLPHDLLYITHLNHSQFPSTINNFSDDQPNKHQLYYSSTCVLLYIVYACNAGDCTFAGDGYVKTCWLADDLASEHRHTAPSSVQVLWWVRGQEWCHSQTKYIQYMWTTEGGGNTQAVVSVLDNRLLSSPC